MVRKTVEVFEKDYDALLIRAGEPNKIAFVVRNLLEFGEKIHADHQKLKAWQDKCKQPQLPF